MPHTLLLADDSVTIQRVIELTFADEDVRVIAVGNGREAISRIGRERPDIVLADVGMPECDGYEVAAFVKGRADLAHTPVLLLTGAFEPVDEIRVRDVGADGVLAKPFEPQELIARVKALLGIGPAAQAAAPAGASDAAGQARVEGPGSGEPAAAETSQPDEATIEASPASPAVSLDDYFDRLDAAFASLAAPAHADEGAIPPVGAVEPAHAGLETPAPPVALAPSPAKTNIMTPADAFAVLLEAEQAHPDATLAVSPMAGGLLAPAGPSIDELVETVASRVLDQLAGTSARTAVADTVSAVAERLVREEIERLKASIA